MKRLGLALLMLIALIMLLATVEGVVTWTNVLRTVAAANRPAAAAAQLSEFDPVLGWRGRADLAAPNVFGPWLDFNTDNRGFRSGGQRAEMETQAVLCLGDEYTLGWGVIDQDNWCAQLQNRAPGVSTSNAAQFGYGFDQIYLSARQSQEPEAPIKVLAFTTFDLDRAANSRFGLQDKPLLKLVDGELLDVASPLSSLAFRWPWVARNKDLLAYSGIYRALFGHEDDRLRLDNIDLENSVTAMLQQLAADVSEQNQRILLVYLPSKADGNNASYQYWQAYMLEGAEKAGLPYLDATAAASELPEAAHARIFLQSTDYLSNNGHAWVAKMIADAMRGLGWADKEGKRMDAWSAEYFIGPDFNRPLDKVSETRLSFGWAETGPYNLPNTYSIKFVGCLKLEQDSEIEFRLQSDDGSRLRIDGEQLIDHWGDHGFEEKLVQTVLSAGVYKLEVDYYERFGHAALDLTARINGTINGLGTGTVRLPDENGNCAGALAPALEGTEQDQKGQSDAAQP